MDSALGGYLHGSMYGARELQQYYRKYISGSLAMSIALQMAWVSALCLFQTSEPPLDQTPRIADFVPYRSLIPLRTVPTNLPSSRFMSGRTQRGTIAGFAIPIPVTNPFSDSSSASPAQPDFSGGPQNNGFGFGTGQIGRQEGYRGEDDVEPPPFRSIEKNPEIARQVDPEYPAVAIRAGIEGTVVLNLWVDRLGRVRKAVVLRSDADVLNASAIDAAKQWVFTPAIMQHDPVSVWISIPFRFRLNEK